MAPIYAGVFFTRTKTSDVLPSENLIGKVEVGRILKARWNSRIYAAKVMCIGSKRYCESQLSHVLTDGTLTTPQFEIYEGSVPIQTPERRVGPDDASSGVESIMEDLKQFMEDVKLSLDSLSTRVQRIEAFIGQESQRLSYRWSDVTEIKGTLEEVHRRVPKPACSEGASATRFEYVDKERLEILRRMSGNDINRFALALEKEVYIDAPDELSINVQDRTKTYTRVDFIKECIFKYYFISTEARDGIWRSAKNALNSRVRRLKSAGKSKPSPFDAPDSNDE